MNNKWPVTGECDQQMAQEDYFHEARGDSTLL